MAKTVAILGGGVAGLSAAHELAERGFSVHVYEWRAVPGGKARGIPVPGTGTSGRPDLPGEHGFRFFPGFYKHLPDTMKRIPFAGAPEGVYSNLVQASEYMIAAKPNLDLTLLVKFPETWDEWMEAIAGIFSGAKLQIPAVELEFFLGRLLIVLTTCYERRTSQLEQIPWWQFIHADSKSDAYRTYLATGLTRALVAMKAEIASTRTVGDILLQLLLDIYNPTLQFDRVLNGPTNEVWLNPWKTHLETTLGVTFHFEHQVTSIDAYAGLIRKVVVRDASFATTDVTADYYIAAMPVEQLVPLITPTMIAAEPNLAGLVNLSVAWMNGIQFFLKVDAPFNDGHMLFSETPWALTAISQVQFWEKPLTDYGDGTATTLLSIDISNWESPGILYGLPAMDLDTPEKIMREVQAQIQSSLRPNLATALDDANIVAWFLDDDIRFPGPGLSDVNVEPLLVNVCGSWKWRPEATTSIPNLYLASDYVRTNTDLATMEGANEAARRAVNGILAHSGSTAAPCAIWPLTEPCLFWTARAIDRLRYDLGMEHCFAGDEIAAELLEAQMNAALAAAVAAAPPSPPPPSPPSPPSPPPGPPVPIILPAPAPPAPRRSLRRPTLPAAPPLWPAPRPATRQVHTIGELMARLRVRGPKGE